MIKLRLLDSTAPIIFRYLEGMRVAEIDVDPGAHEFVAKVAALSPRIDIGKGVYRDFAVQEIADDFKKAPPNAINIGGGTSLGCNNIAAIGQYVGPGVTIHGIWGFQASDDGLKAQLGSTYEGIASNVLFAHEVYNPIWLQTLGLGHYQWVRAPGNMRTALRTDCRYDFHPGETEEIQAMYLAEIAQMIGVKA